MATKGRLSADKRRAVIEDAAARIFAERGYATTTLDEIAAAAGVTKPVLYRHFESKKALHLALLAKHRDGLLGRISSNANPEVSLQDQLPAILDAWFAYVEDNPYAWKLLFRDTTGDPEIQAFHQELHASARFLTARLLDVQPDLAVAPGQTEVVAEFIRSATTGLALWWLDHPEIPRAALVEVVNDLLQGGLLGQSDSSG